MSGAAKQAQRAGGEVSVEKLRERVNAVRGALGQWFVDKQEVIDLMTLATLAQEPLLLVGPPGTAKSELVVRFCESLGLADDEYFEYMLTRFSEPGELLGPVDIARMKEGRWLRRVEGKLPTAKIAFLDEIFKSNSAILNTLLTIINERKFYQDGRPQPVDLQMLFAATNQIPDLDELAALRDRFVLKVQSRSVKDTHFDALIEKGLAAELDRRHGRRPWANLASLDDFVALKDWLDETMSGGDASAAGEDGDDSPIAADRRRFFPDDVYSLFAGILRTLEREDGVVVSDRKLIKLYRLIRTRAFLHHGGSVRKDDLVVLRHVADREEDMGPVRQKVDALLRVG